MTDVTSTSSRAPRRPPAADREPLAEPGAGLPTPFAEAVLDLVERIPPGRAMAYGDVAAVLGTGGARAVGTVMARFGSGVPWHRVVRSDGSPPRGHEAEALRRHRREGTPLAAAGTRLDLAAARWWPGDEPSAPAR
ncbi:MAG: cysteine methyltransferase [Frankiales bacterium]|nr:cysteine methyltransferase [Frankiales bacterium]